MFLNWRTLLFAITISLSLNTSLEANHIIGGDFVYECMGFLNNDPTTNTMVYRVTLDLYRDCQARNAAFFDGQAGMAIFRGTPIQNILFSEGFATYRDNGPPVDIDPPQFPCLIIPSNVCVHTAKYVFDLALPISNESYHLVWQRCCRNQSITNIYDPGSIGATFTLEITPFSQQQCNSSPSFNEFPPTVICVDEPLRFDHSATDADGDDLVYEFCAPLKGGGNNFGGQGSCDSPNPNPDCPPPFDPVDFRAPNFTSSFPLGGNPRVDIDPITGMISGTPNVQGQFVVGVCVKEYRNGTLLTTVRRDFQFNVSTCEANFRANLDADDVSPDGDYIIRLCDTLTRRIANNSQGQIDSVEWLVDTGGYFKSYFEWSPEVTFATGGVYDGFYIINPGSPCSDTAKIQFVVTEQIKADFIPSYDTCIVGPVDFINQSTIKTGRIVSYEWDLDERKTDTVREPRTSYEDPGLYDIQLIITDQIGCRDTASTQVLWQPAPEVIVIRPDVEEGCNPLAVQFENLSYPFDSSYRVRWIFSDGDTAVGFQPQKSFGDIGVYSIKVEITSPIGCYTEETFDSVIQVFPRPNADFIASTYAMDVFDPNTVLSDISSNGVGREWWIDGESVYFDSTLAYMFEDTGSYQVMLISVDRFGCVDTLTRQFDVAPVNTMYFPNAFTPNTDGKNDFFGPVGLLEGVRDYELKVYNRWGESIFYSDEINTRWNGQLDNNGIDCQEGIYIMECQYTEPRGKKVTLKNVITLIR